MWHITTAISGHHDTHSVGAAVFFICAGIIIAIAFGDALAVLTVAIAIWWMYRKVEHRLESTNAEMAPVTRLRPELTGQRDLKSTPARASRRFRRAA
jgi:hypothetical protein